LEGFLGSFGGLFCGDTGLFAGNIWFFGGVQFRKKFPISAKEAL